MPNNREWALLFWLGVFLVFVLSKRDIRFSFGKVFRAASSPGILVPFTGMVGYVVLEAWLGSKVSFWRPSLLKDTIVWFVVSALALFFNLNKATQEPHFFRRRAIEVFGITTFLEFFTNLFVLNLAAELLLQPVFIFVAMLSAYTGTASRYSVVKKLTDSLLAIGGLSLLAYVSRQLYVNWGDLDKQTVLLQLVLPIWLTLGLLPFIYLLSLYSTYDWAFRGVNWATDNRRARWRARLALATKFHIRSRRLRSFPWHSMRQLTAAPTLAAARRAIEERLGAQRDADRAVEEEQDRLRHYAGSDETDADGRRLDRREFKETTRALHWLATSQMGWYRNENHRGRYRADLLNLLSDSFTAQGLPSEHGITMRVAKNGKTWFAWRQTVTGWCFAIGASGPPPNQWEYDGPEPPQGFPGKDRRWGANSLSGDTSRNW